jgi:hypothetical protein
MSCGNIHFIGEGWAGNEEDAGFVHRGETFFSWTSIVTFGGCVVDFACRHGGLIA